MKRRDFLRTAGISLAAGYAGLLPGDIAAQSIADSALCWQEFPAMDLHVHLDNSTIDKVVELSGKLGVKFGIVEHAGTKENKYPTVLSNDEELEKYLKMLEGKSVYRGVQTEWTDWASGFSKEALGKLDFVLTDCMTYPGKDGQRTKLFEKGVEDRVDMSDREEFMDKYVDWCVKIISSKPLDILANVSWLPEPLAADYDKLWTMARMKRFIDTAVQNKVALEISAKYELPKLTFLEIAKEAGIKFTFGSNGRYPNMGKLDYSLRMAKELGLKRSDMFIPARKS
jgi:histidinol phosphatase-like PHP family hydrolase